MRSFHPQSSVLENFACGELDGQLSVLTSSHLEGCRKCSSAIKEIEEKQAESFFSESDAEIINLQIPNLNDIQERILDTAIDASVTPINKPKDISPNKFTVEGKEVDLPTSIASLKDHMSSWKKINSNISYANINVHGEGKLYLVYFQPGAVIPEHTHDGNEYAYVVAGSFTDGTSSEYISGDFACFTHNDTHNPYTDDPDGCLLLVKLDGPFVFKNGLARLINPFRKFLFKKS